MPALTDPNTRPAPAPAPPTTADTGPAAREAAVSPPVKFYLGTHAAHWVTTSKVPLFLSRRVLQRYRTVDGIPRARCSWALDSGGFTELRDHGTWRIDADEYGGMVYRFLDQCGAPPDFCAPMDWMCEPWVLRGGRIGNQYFVGTGMTVAFHQAATIENFLYLTEQFPAAPWMPVLQGWHLDEYLDHVAQYAAAGVDLAREPIVGLGSVCRRQSTNEIGTIVAALAGLGIALHGFGVKQAGLARYGHHLRSADSMAWSLGARKRRIRLPQCVHRAATCQNCWAYALTWRDRVVASLAGP